MSYMGQFWFEHAKWSQDTFGSDKKRGSLGPLRHLKKEAVEAIEAAEYLLDTVDKVQGLAILHEEIVDCQFLVFDAARRAGIGYNEFIDLCFMKLEKNKKRTWQKPTSDEPVEHER